MNCNQLKEICGKIREIVQSRLHQRRQNTSVCGKGLNDRLFPEKMVLNLIFDTIDRIIPFVQ